MTDENYITHPTANYAHDSADGKWHDEYWCIKVIGPYDTRWLTGFRCFSSWTHRIRFASKTEARKWYWDTVLCHQQTYIEKMKHENDGTVLPYAAVVKLIHVIPKHV